ncbi:MAG: TIGR00153 family protein [Nitrospinales bacterium]
MRSILSLFSKSPFKPLAHHIGRVRACIDQVKPLFAALNEKDYGKIRDISHLIMKVEHDADVIKTNIRNNLLQSLFMAVDKRDFLRLLSAQDDMADAVEDLAVLLRIKNLETPGIIQEPLDDLVAHVVNTAYLACDLINELDNLLEASFGGKEAEKVENEVERLGAEEWEADKKQFMLAQKLFSVDDELKAADLMLWNEVIKKLGAVADKAETIGKILRLFLAK